MYAGTFEVSRQVGKNHNLFYWLFKNLTLSGDQKAPLIIWVQGETGWSATQGLFAQNGPLQVTRVPNGQDWTYSVGLAGPGESLLEIGDVVYLDQPVGTGFSYGASDIDVLTSMDDVSNEFVNFVDSLVKMYPEYKAPRKIILMGESTAGKFIPRFTKALDGYIK